MTALPKRTLLIENRKSFLCTNESKKENNLMESIFMVIMDGSKDIWRFVAERIWIKMLRMRRPANHLVAMRQTSSSSSFILVPISWFSYSLPAFSHSILFSSHRAISIWWGLFRNSQIPSRTWLASIFQWFPSLTKCFFLSFRCIYLLLVSALLV